MAFDLKKYFILVFVLLLSCSKGKKDEPTPDPLEIRSLLIGGETVASSALISISVNAEIVINFSSGLSPQTNFHNFISLLNKKGETLPCHFQLADQTLTIRPAEPLPGLQKFTFVIRSGLPSAGGSRLQRETSFLFFTEKDDSDKMDRISDEELLRKVQQHTFRYFYDFAHPASGMTRERNTSQNTVTTGGTGFGLMALCVGAERAFITRAQGVEQLTRVVTFLENARKYHGAFSHWYDGNTGLTLPFSTQDNGADLVETSFLMMGLLTAGEYFGEPDLNRRIDQLYQAVEWNFFLNGSESLFWHWSPDHGFALNLKIRGWNEALMTYILAAGSEKYGIEKAHYAAGWTRNGGFVNGNNYHGIRLPLGPEYGGPLFLSQYTFLGINPFGLSDEVVPDYAVQCRNHTLINRAYCIENPENFPGYDVYSWGLTASDNPTGYAAHSPRNDLGVIAPSAALGSFPYTPEESKQALEFFYYSLGDKLWGEYGFKDAYSIKDDWYADSYIAIDQGPIIIGIENYRSGLLWENCMKSPVVKRGLAQLGLRSQ